MLPGASATSRQPGRIAHHGSDVPRRAIRRRLSRHRPRVLRPRAGSSTTSSSHPAPIRTRSLAIEAPSGSRSTPTGTSSCTPPRASSVSRRPSCTRRSRRPTPVAADYVVDGEGHVRFRLGAYDASRPLVIDPVLAYATYLGGTGDEAEVAFGAIAGIARRRGRQHLRDRARRLRRLPDDARRRPDARREPGRLRHEALCRPAPSSTRRISAARATTRRATSRSTPPGTRTSPASVNGAATATRRSRACSSRSSTRRAPSSTRPSSAAASPTRRSDRRSPWTRKDTRT